ncbi:MAG TPA: hydroxymethylglutaryl-CoA lyase [Acidobacteriaceae bacterium]|jgi:hydroxymethylglutaryl-CoA lyase|nr:hydroxymethylglutaryl-CoA lyase [Acidobacteriaceae bacterium]
MPSPVKIVECPRDAWQGLPKIIPPDVKADYLRMLVAGGFRHIDAVSFVSEKAVPQMADSEQTLALLDPSEDVEIIGIVVNEKGADRAIDTGSVTTLGFPYSISATFLERNQRQTPEQSLDTLEAIGERAFRAGLDLVVYISMAFGNPYGDAWSVEEVTEACRLLADNGVTQISLADTVGVADASQIAQVLDEVLPAMNEEYGELEVGVHLHARPADAAGKVLAAYRAGCRRFDAALTGLGGCPFAQDALVGNIATETALAALRDAGAELPPLQSLDELIAAARMISSRFGSALQ